LAIVAYNWASERYLYRRGRIESLRLGLDEELETNITLAKLLQESFGREFKDVFATNIFVFVKPGPMSGRIPSADLQLSARTYTIPELEIVRPKMAICLGSAAYNALRRIYDRPYQALKYVDYNMADLRLRDTEIYGVPHPGALGQAATGGYPKSLKIWKLLAKRLGRLQDGTPTEICNRPWTVKTVL
jgi:restriction system protein